ncbi:hypothetical protein [Micromonospora sp. NPDC049645]|uniref:hypothetical protein n=1 Tax=Micromonospora sp. NPDC049645 TaxID=3155508 RepID=UPI003432812F
MILSLGNSAPTVDVPGVWGVTPSGRAATRLFEVAGDAPGGRRIHDPPGTQ